MRVDWVRRSYNIGHVGPLLCQYNYVTEREIVGSYLNGLAQWQSVSLMGGQCSRQQPVVGSELDRLEGEVSCVYTDVQQPGRF